MVERVARALAVADGKDPDAPAWIKLPGGPYGLCWRDQYADKARLAIRVMREPTDMMVVAAERFVVYDPDTEGLNEHSDDLWRAMIDRALEESSDD
jgi:hypothetical protein